MEAKRKNPIASIKKQDIAHIYPTVAPNREFYIIMIIGDI